MKRFMYVGGTAAIICFVIMSCQSEQPTSPLPTLTDRSLSIQIAHLDSVIDAQEGELHPTAFEVTVTDESGIPAVEAAVTIGVVSGPGQVAPETALTDSGGVVRSLYYLTVPYGDTSSTIRATTEGDTADFTITIRGRPAPVEIILEASQDTFALNYGQPAEGSLSARVLDRRGAGVPDRTVIFSLVTGQAAAGGIGN